MSIDNVRAGVNLRSAFTLTVVPPLVSACRWRLRLFGFVPEASGSQFEIFPSPGGQGGTHTCKKHAFRDHFFYPGGASLGGRHATLFRANCGRSVSSMF
jgi:hypothetical protein